MEKMIKIEYNKQLKEFTLLFNDNVIIKTNNENRINRELKKVLNIIKYGR